MRLCASALDTRVMRGQVISIPKLLHGGSTGVERSTRTLHRVRRSFPRQPGRPFDAVRVLASDELILADSQPMNKVSRYVSRCTAPMGFPPHRLIILMKTVNEIYNDGKRHQTTIELPTKLLKQRYPYIQTIEGHRRYPRPWIMSTVRRHRRLN